MTRKTPLFEIHQQLGARIVEFAGWQMPVQYTSVREEHLAVRKDVGIFDVSHMGEILVEGPQAEAFVQKVTCNDASRLMAGHSQYSAFLTEQGTFIDDIIVNRLSEKAFLICVNASNADKNFQHVSSQESPQTKVENQSDDYFLIALQGPRAESLLKEEASIEIPSLPFSFTRTRVADRSVLLSRTGYTGEDGFEIYGLPKDAETVWQFLMEKKATPCGLGARDTLRIEASYPLYGHEIDDTINPYEARLGWIVKMSKGDFIGREALGRIRDSPLQKKLVGLEMQEAGIPRQGYTLFHGEETIGHITSGTFSPFLDRAISLGYVKLNYSGVGTKIEIDIHRKKRHAVVVSLPFYKKK